MVTQAWLMINVHPSWHSYVNCSCISIIPLHSIANSHPLDHLPVALPLMEKLKIVDLKKVTQAQVMINTSIKAFICEVYLHILSC